MKKAIWIIPALFTIALGMFHFNTLRTYGSYQNKRIILSTLERKQVHLRNPGFEEQLRREKLVGLDDFPYGISAKWLEQDALLARSTDEASPFDSIVELGPSSVGGRTRAIHIDPVNPDRILAGGISGGIWVSEDRGVNWRVLDDKASNLSVSSITYNPFNPQIIYYSTGEARGGGGIGSGVFKSTDNGETFHVLPATLEFDEFRYSWKIAHSLTENNTVFVGTYRGLFRSTDGGESWSSVLNIQGKAANDVLTFDNGMVMAAIDEVGLFTSPSGDPGTFTQIDPANFPEAFTRIKIAYCATQQDNIYAMFAVDIDQVVAPKVYRSTDYGATWERKSTPPISGTQRRYNMMLGVHPTNPSKVVIGTVLSAYTDNGAATWFYTGLSHSDYHEYVSFPDNTTQFLVGNDGGIYLHRWNDIFVTTDRNRGYNVTQFYGGSYHPETQANIGGTQDNGTIRVKPGGQFSYVFGADGGYAHVNQQAPEYAYFSTQLDGLFKVQNWTDGQPIPSSIMYGPMGNEGVSFINAYEMNYADGNQLYYKTNQAVWRTVNEGQSWQRLGSDTIRSIVRLSLTEETDPHLYFAGQDADDDFYIRRNTNALTDEEYETIFKLSDHSLLFPSSSVKMDVHPNNNNRILFTYYNYTSILDQCWMLDKIKAGSAELINITGNLPDNLPVNVLKFHPDHPDSIFLAATDFGLYYTLDAGQSWQKDERFPNVQIFDMRIRASDHKVFLYTYGRGIWSADLKESVFTPHPIPHTEGFESGNWQTGSFSHRSNGNGRVKVVAREDGPDFYYLNLDMSTSEREGGNCSFIIPIDPGDAEALAISYFYFLHGTALESTLSGVYVSSELHGDYVQIRSFGDLTVLPAAQDLIIYPVETTGPLYFKFEYTGELETPSGGISLDEIVIQEFSVPTAIQEDLISGLKLYPNPASSVVNLELPSRLEIDRVELVNASGTTVQTWSLHSPVDQELTISPAISPGNYFLKFSYRDVTLGSRQLIVFK